MSQDRVPELAWLVDFVSKLPKVANRTTTFYDIASANDKETLLTKVIAHFLDPRSEHGMGRLFLDAILTFLPELSGRVDVSPVITAEKSTWNGRLDLLITPPDPADAGTNRTAKYEWAIIIEHKINAAWTIEQLERYDEAIKAKKKVIVLLCLREPTEALPGVTIITHRRLFEVISKNLHSVFQAAHPKHLLYLQDLLINVDNFYYMEKNSDLFQKQLLQFNEDNEHIAAFDDMRFKLGKYVGGSVNETLREFGFEPAVSSDMATERWFNPSDKWMTAIPGIESCIGIWVDTPKILNAGLLDIYVALRNPENTAYGQAVVEAYKKATDMIKDRSIEPYTEADALYGGAYYVCGLRDYPLDLNLDLKMHLKDVLAGTFFVDEDTIVDWVWKKLDELKKKQIAS